MLLLLAGCGSLPVPGAREPAEAVDAAPVIPAEVQTQYEQAVASMAAGDDVEALLRFEAFVLSYPDYANAHVNLAMLKARAGDDAGAAEALEAALAIEPAHAAALNQRGMLKRRAGQFEAAENDYLAAIAARPDYALAHYNLGVLYELYLQRLEPALAHFEQFQALSTEDMQVDKWIADLRRRIAAHQRTANVTE